MIDLTRSTGDDVTDTVLRALCTRAGRIGGEFGDAARDGRAGIPFNAHMLAGQLHLNPVDVVRALIRMHDEDFIELRVDYNLMYVWLRVRLEEKSSA